jgi:antiviral helicase SKI2
VNNNNQPYRLRLDKMANSLAESMQKLTITSESTTKDDDWIDSILDQQRPRKRVKQDAEELKQELERKYLTPSTTFSTAWLNILQQ